MAVVAGVVALASGGIATTLVPAGNGSTTAEKQAQGPMGGMRGMNMQVKDEFGYLTMMIPHHEEAITSARVLLAGTSSPRMKRFARTIIKTQRAEVAQMKEWLATWYPGRDTAVAYEPMMRGLRKLAGADLDRAFLRDMIPHHMMAVMMSQQVVAGDLVEHDAVVRFSKEIRDTQRAEIRMMARWLSGATGGGMGAMGGGRRGQDAGMHGGHRMGGSSGSGSGPGGMSAGMGAMGG